MDIYRSTPSINPFLPSSRLVHIHRASAVLDGQDRHQLMVKLLAALLSLDSLSERSDAAAINMRPGSTARMPSFH
jgi:hypothetical protein